MTYVDVLNDAVIYADRLNIYAKNGLTHRVCQQSSVFVNTPLDILSLHFPDEPKIKQPYSFRLGSGKNMTVVFFLLQAYSVELAKGAASVYVLAPSSLSSIYMP